MKIAIVHDWLVGYRGGEKVLKAICELYPDAPIYTLFYDRSALPKFFANKTIITPSFSNQLRSFRKGLLPFLPSMIESLDLQGYDLVISTSSCVAKGVIVPPEAKHISYIHSPMRYAWDQRFEYLRGIRRIPILGWLLELILHYLRLWDTVSTARVDTLVANSTFVQARIKTFYHRRATVIYPPIEVDHFVPKSPVERALPKKRYFLVAGAMVPYKRFDLAIEACEKACQPLIVAGSGPEYAKLAKMAGTYTTVIHAPDDKALKKLLQEAEALIFPGVEDFGMIAVEAMACGTPVIAYRSGGARDFVVEQITGIFFDTQTTAALQSVLEKWEENNFSSEIVAEHAKKFSVSSFKKSFRALVDHAMGV